MSPEELWNIVYGCAETGSVRPAAMTNFFFDALHQVVDEAETLVRSGDTHAGTAKLRELQSRCERLIRLFEPNTASPLRLVM